MNKHKGRTKAPWLHPGTPEDLAYYEDKAREECARFERDSQTIAMTFEVSGDDRIMVDEAVNRAMEFTGTSLPGIALEHIATAYIQNGPLAKAMNRMDARNNAKKIGLSELMKEVGAEDVMEVFSSLFPQNVRNTGGVGEKQ